VIDDRLPAVLAHLPGERASLTVLPSA
jgi:hypothetical protein